MEKYRFPMKLRQAAPIFLASSLLFIPVHASASILKILIDGFSSVFSSEISKESVIEMTVEKQISDQKVLQDYKNKVSEVDRKLNRQNNINICNNMAVVNAEKSAMQGARRSVVGGVDNSSLRSASTVNAEADAVASYNNAMIKYCTQADIATGRCSKKGTQVDAMAGADMHATTLFSAIGSDDPNETYADANQEAAADEFIRRVASPNPPEMLTKSCFTPQCKTYEDYRRSYLAINSIAVNSLNEVKSSHLPGGASVSSSQVIKVADATDYIRKSTGGVLYSYISSRISPNTIKSAETKVYTASLLSATHLAASRLFRPINDKSHGSEGR